MTWKCSVLIAAGLLRGVAPAAVTPAMAIAAVAAATDLTAGAWTVAWFCALYGLAVWASPRGFAAGTALVVATDLGLVPFPGQGGDRANVAVPFAAGTLAVMLIIRRIVRDRDRRAELAERERDVTAREAVWRSGPGSRVSCTTRSHTTCR